MFPEGKGLVGGWKILLEKLRQLGVSPKEEPKREQVQGKSKREETQGKKILGSPPSPDF